DPSPIFPILEKLKDDESEYVRRSVANNLNDIAKDHPDRVIEVCAKWWTGASANRRRLVKHALRSLLKAGDPGALAILGFAPPRDLSVSLRISPKEIRVGEAVTLKLAVENQGQETASVMVDYAVHYRLAKGHGRKVFKWRVVEVPAGERLELTKSHAMKKVTIRTLRTGRHPVDVQLNGVVMAKGSFDLEE
ncbi:MAG: hypothetical protein AAF658_19805, partial [Myxococcota bacterium]